MPPEDGSRGRARAAVALLAVVGVAVAGFLLFRVTPWHATAGPGGAPTQTAIGPQGAPSQPAGVPEAAQSQPDGAPPRDTTGSGDALQNQTAPTDDSAASPAARAPADPGPSPDELEQPDAGTIPSAANLLDQDQIARLGLKQRWRVTGTHDNTSGRGINTVCQQSRFADPDGLVALVRSFEARGRPHRSAVQTVEVSDSRRQAVRAYRTTLGWYVGCRTGRVQLLRTYRVDGVGDRAMLLLLRGWRPPVTSYTVGVARVGRVVTSTVGTSTASPTPPGQAAQSLADAVAMLCPASTAADCPVRPRRTVVPPPPSGDAPGLLTEADLPPVPGIDRRWVGTRPRPATFNPAATTCDQAGFTGRRVARTRTRTFLIPGARLPDQFGLSETYGVFRSPLAAFEFLATMRQRVGGCEDRNLATRVRPGYSGRLPGSRLDLSIWELETEVSDSTSVRFRLGFVRLANLLAQVSLAPTETRDLSPGQFRELVVRAGQRLRELR